MPPNPVKISTSIPLLLGIDPGNVGGMVLRDIELDAWKFYPSTGDLHALWNSFLDIGEIRAKRNMTVRAAIERVHAMPGQGVSSMFTFGGSYMSLQMGCVASRIPFELVQPKAWQKTFNLVRDKKDMKANFKKKIAKVAQNLFPDLEIWKWSQGRSLQVVDALLITEHLRRLWITSKT